MATQNTVSTSATKAAPRKGHKGATTAAPAAPAPKGKGAAPAPALPPAGAALAALPAAPAPNFAALVVPKPPKAAPLPPRQPQAVQNGVAHPHPPRGGKPALCWCVWEQVSALATSLQTMPTTAQVVEACTAYHTEHNWPLPVNANNVSQEISRWRKFHGVPSARTHAPAPVTTPSK